MHFVVSKKICPFTALCRGNKNKKNVAQQISTTHRTIYFLQLLETNLLSGTRISQAHSELICSNAVILTVE